MKYAVTLLTETRRQILGTADPITGRLPSVWQIWLEIGVESTSTVILEDHGYISRHRVNGRVRAGTTYLVDNWAKVKVLGTLDSKGIHVR